MGYNTASLKKEDWEELKSGFDSAKKLAPLNNHWIESMILSFPEGQFCRRDNGLIDSIGLSLIIGTEDAKRIKEYSVLNDILPNNSQGDTLFEIGIYIFGKEDSKIWRNYRELFKALCEKRNLRSYMLVTELTNYKKFEDKMTVSEYVSKVSSKEIYDSVLSYQLSGFAVRRILNPPSMSEATYVLMEYNNIYFNFKK